MDASRAFNHYIAWDGSERPICLISALCICLQAIINYTTVDIFFQVKNTNLQQYIHSIEPKSGCLRDCRTLGNTL
jgi:hypothetical protein